MERMKFDVTNKPELSAIIQQMLFELGCSWHTKGRYIDCTEESQLIVWADGAIAYSSTFNPKTWKEFKFTTLEELAAKLQEHYDRKDTVNLGDVVEINRGGCTKPYIISQTKSFEAKLIGLDGNRYRDTTVPVIGNEVFVHELEGIHNCRMIRNLGPLKDLVSVS